jgi:hypothetical protein
VSIVACNVPAADLSPAGDGASHPASADRRRVLEPVLDAPLRDRGTDRGTGPGFVRPGIPGTGPGLLARGPGHQPATAAGASAGRRRAHPDAAVRLAGRLPGGGVPARPGDVLGIPALSPSGSPADRHLGARTAAPAGRIAQEVKIGGTVNPAMVEVMRDRIASGVSEADGAGRSAGGPGIVVGAVTVVDEDGAPARSRARTEVAMYLAVVAELDPTVDVPGGLLARVKDLLVQGRAARPGCAHPPTNYSISSPSSASPSSRGSSSAADRRRGEQGEVRHSARPERRPRCRPARIPGAPAARPRTRYGHKPTGEER